MKISKIVCIILCTLLSGCFMKETKSPVLSKIWNLKSVNSKVLNAQTAKLISLGVNFEDKSFHGNDGCNSIFGRVKLDKKNISFKNMNSTMLMCKDMKTPRLFTELLMRAKTYKIKNNTVYIYDANDLKLLELIR